MSKIRKERKKKKQKRLFVLLVSIILFFVVIGGYIVYKQFVAEKRIETFFPEKPIFFVKLNLSPSLSQGKNLLKISEKFENKDFFGTVLTNFVFGNIEDDEIQIENQDLVNWAGNEIVLGNIMVSQLENLPSMVVKIKNEDKLNEFLLKMKENLEQKGNAVSKETFRENEVVLVKGDNEISYAISSGYLLISQKDSGVKKMIDLSLGKEESLDESKDFQKISKELKAQDEIAFCYFDLLELTGLIMNHMEIGEGNFFEKVGYGSSAPAGLVLSPEAEGFLMKFFVLDEGKSDKEGNFKEKFVKEVPNDLIFYLEGNDLRPFLESLIVGKDGEGQDEAARAEGIKRAIELEFGINVDEDLLDLFKEQYALLLFRGNDDGRLNFAFFFEQKDEKEAAEKLLKFEETLLTLLKKYKPDEFAESRSFTTHQYEDQDYRYLNLPEQYPFDIAYDTFDNKIVLALTEDAMLQALEDPSKKDNLESDHIYKNNLSNVTLDQFRQLIYLEPQAAFKLIDETTKFDYGYLSKEARLLESLGIKSYKTKDGLFLQGFLALKE